MSPRTDRWIAFGLTWFLVLASYGLIERHASAAETAPSTPKEAPDQRIILIPQEGQMVCVARVLDLNDQRFAFGIPETIGERAGMILNFPEVNIHWDPVEPSGAVSHRWITPGKIDYSVRLVPYTDYVDITMTIRNLSTKSWVDVFSFNCLNPVAAPDFLDWTLVRTYMSKDGNPFRMDGTTRINQGSYKTVQFYLHEGYTPSGFVTGFLATSPDKTDGSYIVTLSQAGDSYMAATSPRAAYLFDNLDRCCLHSAPLFGNIAPGGEATQTVRFYLAHGTLDNFLDRYFTDFPTDVKGFKVVNAAGKTVAAINEAGNLIFPGGVFQNSDAGDSDGADFVVRDHNGTVVAAVDSMGSLVLKGWVHENQPRFIPPPGSLLIRNATGALVAYFSPSGDLFLKGKVFGGM